MKSIIRFAVCFTFIWLAMVSSFKKEKQNLPDVNPLNPLPAQAKTVKAKVIEYGSDITLLEAKLSICPQVLDYDGLCPGDYQIFSTDTSGVVYFWFNKIYYSIGFKTWLLAA